MSGRFRRRVRNSCSLALALLLVLPVAAGAAGEFPLTVRDALGRVVAIPGPPQRIVSVAPSVTEILFALGVGPRVVGISDADDYPPPGVRGKPRVGGVALNTERIIALRPDLVIGVAGLQQSQLERLFRLGLPVLAVEARTLEETLSQITLLSRVTGARQAGRRLVQALRSRAAAVEARVRGRPRPRVFVEIWGEPLQTAGAGTYVDDLLRRAGARNLFADLRGWPQVSPEAVVSRNPEVIVLTYAGRRAVVARPGWRGVTAVRRGRIYELDPDLVSRPGPRLLDGLERLARLLHPEAFSP
jgi:iron complex transport system substrate-binding protein